MRRGGFPDFPATPKAPGGFRTLRRRCRRGCSEKRAAAESRTSAQRRLLHRAAALLEPAGTLLYCTCSLEPEENEQQIAALLARRAGLRRCPIAAEEVAGLAELVSPLGDLRTLPCHLADPDPRWAGLDGFYAARLERTCPGQKNANLECVNHLFDLKP